MSKHPDIYMRNQLTQTWAVMRTEGPIEVVSRTYRITNLKLGGVTAYQRPITNRLRQLAKTHSTLIDIGAAAGDLVQSVARDFENILAIEPAPHNFKILKTRKAKGDLQHTRILKCAVGANNGKALLGLSADNPDDNSLVHRNDLEKYITVNQQTLDKIVEQYKLPKPIVIKMDVQGYEANIIKGATKTLQNGCTILMEYWPWGLESAGTDPLELLSSLTKRGYRISNLSGKAYAWRKIDRLTRLGRDNPFVVTDLVLSQS